MQYTVESDGHVADVSLKHGDATLFESVKSWLERCSFTPSRGGDGKAIPVKMIQPFEL